MSFTTDKYLVKEFNIVNYNCWDFIREVWQELKGIDIGMRTPTPATRQNMRTKFTQEENHFLKLDKPVDPCIVLFKRDKSTPHVGIFYKGKVLHLKENGAQYQNLDIASLGFTEIGFYTCKQ